MKSLKLLLVLIFCLVASIAIAQDCKYSKKIVKKAKKHLVDDEVEKATKFRYLFSKFSQAAGTSIVKSDKAHYLNLVLSREMGRRIDINKDDPLVIQFKDNQVLTLYPDRDTPGKFTLPVTTEVSRAYYILSKEQLEIFAAQSISHLKVYFTSEKVSEGKYGEDDLGKFFDYEVLKERYQTNLIEAANCMLQD